MQPEALLRTHFRSFTIDSLSYVISAMSKCPNSRGSARGDYLQVLSFDGCNAASNLQQLWWTSGIQENIRSIRKKIRPSKTPTNLLPLKQLKVTEIVFSVHCHAYAITGEEDQHDVVRSLICGFIASTGNIKVESMRRNRVWGTTTEMLAAANMFHVNVCVGKVQFYAHMAHIHRPKCRVVNESVYLDNEAGNHFNVVIRV